MQEVLNHFEALSKIPHCSFETQGMKDFLVDFARQCGAEVSVDEAGNIYACKGEPKICLQSHYDMVCMGKAPTIELYEEQGYLKAKDSSLGADNGMGVAIMMEALKNFSHLECLWTNNEEVGLLGANHLSHQLKAKKLLNLDHESDQEVTIGCAGGVDVFVRADYKMKEKTGDVYEVEVYGYKGGHSGVNILQNATNAIKTLASFIAQNKGEIIEFSGGERINSIPKHARALVMFPDSPKEVPHIQFSLIGRQKVQISAKSTMFLKMINSFAHGLRVYDSHLQIAQTSINLAIAKMQKGQIGIELFARSNDLSQLEAIQFETLEFFSLFECEVEDQNFYPPWEPRKSAFSEEVLGAMKASNPNADYYAIHAGLECGIIGSKQGNLECCSIGPNIDYPHSVDERCEIASVERIAKTVFQIIESNQQS